MPTTINETVSLDDKYLLEKGRVFLSGTQALVRLLIAIRQRDTAAGLNTGVFVSGYRGSPLGGLGHAMWSARAILEARNIRFVPGVNEDLAATAVWGTQQINLNPGSQVDGVAGIWYGKGPGADRSLDVFKHANAAGVDPRGGVLAILGDDHGCESSTLAHQSEEVMVAARMPLLFPSNLAEYIEFGVKGIALSRFSGCWVGFKAVSETVDGSATIDVDPLGITINTPDDFTPPPGGLGIRYPDPPLEVEKRLHGPRMEAVAAFARANPFDAQIWRGDAAKLGIIATGKAYVDTRQAIALLGIDETRATALGLAIYKVGLIWPLETAGALAFANGLDELLFIEEKFGIVEEQFRLALYDRQVRPRILGKRDENGKALVPSAGVLSPVQVALIIGEQLMRHGGDEQLAVAIAALRRKQNSGAVASTMVRKPYFCSGCPHNSSTVVPEGSRAFGGIGCHGLALQMDRNTEFRTHMGAEGVTWIGQSLFNGGQHIFQNIGDGTYYHSGLLAIRAAAAAGVNITYKILFNDAVAMTGGQAHDGPLTVPAITRQVAAEGAHKVYVVTDEADKYPSDTDFAPGVKVFPREQLDQVQRELRDTPGLTVLVYDQTCAAEKRRRRKRGLYPDPPQRVFINDRVCEGCGDCGAKSNCVAVKPLETDYGRKRTIDQSDCNKDFSCLRGFCPSFVTVDQAAIRRPRKSGEGAGASSIEEGLPLPTPSDLARPWQILITGIGGTGVITLGSLIGMAAHVEGLGATVLDYTGLAQKNGAVMSHISIARSTDELHAVRIADGQSDAVIACDMIVAAGASALSRMSPDTRAIINGTVQPTSDFIRNGDMEFDNPSVRGTLLALLGSNADFVNATELATKATGDSVATNAFMLGYAWQKGLIPLGRASLLRAIELNAVAVEANKRAFAIGRRAAVEGAQAATRDPVLPLAVAEDLDMLVERRKAELVRYMNAAYAERYATVIEKAVSYEARLAKPVGFARAVAENLYKLMAYKDEYEVARLYADPQFKRKLSEQFEDGYKLRFHLAPPLISPRDPVTGELVKRTYGSWMLPVFRVLARGKVLRGTWLDPFGHSHERKTERGLIEEYVQLVDEIGGKLDDSNADRATSVMAWPQTVRGYGHVKERALAESRERFDALRAAFLTDKAPVEAKAGGRSDARQPALDAAR